MIDEKPHKRENTMIAAALAFLVLLAWLIWMFGNTKKGARALIFCDGRRVAEIVLADYDTPTIIPLSQLGVDRPVSFEIDEQKIRFVNVDCPDHLCEGFGFINLPTQTAVCMPNRVSLSLVER